MAQRGRVLEFTQEEIEDLADTGFGDGRLFALLTLLFPFLDLRNRFHVDHVFPASRFTPAHLRNSGIGDEPIETFRDSANRLGNLQLLDGDVNNEKRAKMPSEWLTEHFPDPQTRKAYCDRYFLGEVPVDICDFIGFYETRRLRLQQRSRGIGEFGLSFVSDVKTSIFE